MSDNSYPDTQSCIEMWRNAVPITWQQRAKSQGTAHPLPSALSSSDAPPPSALSDDVLRIPSALSSEAGSIRYTTSAMSIASHGHHTGEPVLRLASFSSTLAENGSAFSLTSERAVQLVLERERIQNKLVQDVIEAAERNLANFLQLVAGPNDGEHEDKEHEVSHSIVGSLKSASGKRITFTAGDHPENRKPLRRTPTVLPILCDLGYLADDERNPTTSSRRKTRRPGYSVVPLHRLALPPPTLEPLRSPVYVLRALKSSEVWDQEVSGPVLRAPVPLRPFREPELLLVGYNEKARDNSASASSDTAGMNPH